MNNEKIVDAAREWIGTPYRHQEVCKGIGCDCLGLVRGVWDDVIGDMAIKVPNYTPDWNEASGEEVLWRAAQRFLIPTNIASRGDVLLFRIQNGSVAKHLGIQTEIGPAPRFIHAYSGHHVCENHLTRPWSRRIVARFKFPERSL